MGKIIIRNIFQIKNIGIGGGIVLGTLDIADPVTITRNDKIVYYGYLQDMKHYVEDITIAYNSMECGISLLNFTFQIGDIIETI